MKKNIEIFLFLLFIFGSISLFFYSNHQNSLMSGNETTDEWLTYEKQEKGIRSYPTNKEDLIQISATEINKRAPASVKKSNITKKRIIKFQDKNLYDLKVKNFKITNKINPFWKKNLAKESLRFQKKSTKLHIKKEKSFLLVKNYKGLYVEQVVLTYHFKDGKINSATALINSDTGHIIKIWNRTKHEKRFEKMSGASKI